MYFLHEMGIFHCHVSLPEGNWLDPSSGFWKTNRCKTSIFRLELHTSHLDGTFQGWRIFHQFNSVVGHPTGFFPGDLYPWETQGHPVMMAEIWRENHQLRLLLKLRNFHISGVIFTSQGGNKDFWTINSKIHGNGIFTYMNGWFLMGYISRYSWYIYHLHGSYG